MSVPDRRGPVGRSDASGPPSRAGGAGPLSLARHVAGDARVVIEVRGEVDFATVPQLREAISAALDLDPPPGVIVLDLAGVSALDSTGVGTVVVAYRICAHVGVQLMVGNASPFVRRLLEVAGVAERLMG